MKKLIIKFIIYISVVLLIVFLIHRNIALQNEVSRVSINMKAIIAENNGLSDRNLAFQLTLDELESMNDSISNKMVDVLEELKIKPKTVTQIQYQKEVITKTDTLKIRDTIFINPTFKLDTCLLDKWSETRLSLSYPGNIKINSIFNNEKYVIVHSKREPIRPHKCKFVNFFRKKHTVLEIEVVDKNPYVKTERQRFIEIIK